MGNPFLGIALGGGGARGAAHVGVLQVLDKSSIKIDSISGVSAGAIVGAMYAYSMDAKWVEKKFRDVISSNIFKKILSKADFGKDSSSLILGRLKRFQLSNLGLDIGGLSKCVSKRLKLLQVGKDLAGCSVPVLNFL